MTLDEIKQLITLAQETGVGELEVQRGENRVRVRLAAFAAEVTAAPLAQAYAAPAGVASPIASAPQPASADPATDPNVVLVKSPIVGTFYESPSPDAAAFVKIGDTVRKGQVLCIIESMKLMNEIESEYSGVIVSKLVQNGHAVEYGEAMFTVRQS